MYQLSANTAAMHIHSNFLERQGLEPTVDMNNYPNVLTPPMDSPDSTMLSPSSGSNSPHQNYMGSGYINPYSYTSVMQLQGTTNSNSSPFLTVVEEPVERFRFRYKSEMAGTHGSLNGRTSDRSRKQTYPTVELHNFDKPAVVRCSLYQWGREDMIHTRQPHAHRLVKKQGSEEIDDPHDMHVNVDTGFVANFHSMGIIHTAKKYIVPELLRKNTKLKEEEVSRTEYKSRTLTKKEELEVKLVAEKESKSINLNIVCLRFDAFKIVNNIYYPLCKPVYTHAINNLKSALTGDLKIVRMDHCTSPSRGGREIFILVEKVTKKNIKVRFYELDDDDNEIWSDFGRFSDLDVHHQYAIVFKTPPYKILDIDRQVKVCIELQRPSDGARSEPKDFTYTPPEISLGRKRARCSSSGYTSSSFSSDEIPLTINNLSMNPSPLNPQVLNNFMDVNMVNSDDLEDALKHGKIDSTEFENLCKSLLSVGPIQELYAEHTNITNEDLIGLTMDAPQISFDERFNHSDLKPVIAEGERPFIRNSPTKKLDPSDQEIVDRVRTELVAFIKTNPVKKRVTVMLENLFTKPCFISESGDSVLHLLVSENNHTNNFLLFLLKVMLKYQQTDLINLRNKIGQTALHLAVESRNSMVVEHLMYTRADVSLQDFEGNTALHLAVMKSAPITIVKLLLTPGSDTKKYIDALNYDGHTALHLAVKTNNVHATRLLCLHLADVNADDKKNGYTALHMAVADQHVEIIHFLLDNTDIEPEKEDYGQCNPLKLAKVLMREDKPITKEIYNILEHFMKNNGIFEEVDIKEEIEEMSDEEIEVSTDQFKDEPMSPHDYRQKYSLVKGFTETCLNEVAAILDKSGTWQNLADLFDYGYLLRTDLFSTLEKPAKTLLEYAMTNGENLLQVRDFLEHLDETHAVDLIDKMVDEECEKMDSS